MKVTNKANSKGAAIMQGVMRDLPTKRMMLLPRSSCCGSDDRIPIRRHRGVGFSRPSTFR